MKMNNTTPLVTLAVDILRWATTVSDFFSARGLPQPSFELDGPDDYPVDLPEAVQEARTQLRSAASAMGRLAAGPKESLMWMSWGYHDVSTLMYVNHYRIAEAVPLVGSIAITDIAASTGTSERQLRRILRYLTLHDVFAEPEAGRIAHTPASRQMVTADLVKSWIGVRTEETALAAFNLVSAFEKWGVDADERDQTPYSLAHGGGKLSRFDFLAMPENKYRQARFGTLMKAFMSTPGYKLEHTSSGYPWQDLGENATVVDVGGNTGATALALTQSHPNLRIIVQDLPSVVSQARETLSDSHALDRIEFAPYNFFDEVQPVTDASAYLFRQIFHDWPDKYAARALSNTASVMKPGQKLIIVDVVMPAPGTVLPHVETQIRRSDMEMMTQFNSLEREAPDWEALIKRADARLEIKSIQKPAGSVNTVIEVVVGSEGLVEQQETKEREVLTNGRHDSLIFADTEHIEYGLEDMKTDDNAFASIGLEMGVPVPEGGKVELIPAGVV